VITYPLSLGLHSQTDIVQAINDVNARLAAIESHPWTPAIEGKPVQRPASPGDDAAVHQIVNMVRSHLVESTSLEIAEHFDTCCAKVVLTAIRAGQVPFLGDVLPYHRKAEKDQLEITDLKAKLAAAEFALRGLPESNADLCNQLDLVRAELAEAMKVTIPPGCFDKAAESANLKPWPAGNEEPTGDDWKYLRKALDLGPLVSERERVREAVRQINDLKATITSLNDERTALHLGADERDQLRAELAEARDLLGSYPHADFTGPTTGPAPETGVAGSGANPC
jgi:hypothetical protein